MKVELTLERYEQMRNRIEELEKIVQKLTDGHPDICIERNFWAGTSIRLINSTGVIERLKAEAESQKDRAELIMDSKLPFFCIGGKTVREALK